MVVTTVNEGDQEGIDSLKGVGARYERKTAALFDKKKAETKDFQLRTAGRNVQFYEAIREEMIDIHMKDLSAFSSWVITEDILEEGMNFPVIDITIFNRLFDAVPDLFKMVDPNIFNRPLDLSWGGRDDMISTQIIADRDPSYQDESAKLFYRPKKGNSDVYFVSCMYKRIERDPAFDDLIPEARPGITLVNEYMKEKELVNENTINTILDCMTTEVSPRRYFIPMRFIKNLLLDPSTMLQNYELFGEKIKEVNSFTLFDSFDRKIGKEKEIIEKLLDGIENQEDTV